MTLHGSGCAFSTLLLCVVFVEQCYTLFKLYILRDAFVVLSVELKDYAVDRP